MEIDIATSLSKAIQVLKEETGHVLIFIGHKLIKDTELSDLAKELMPIINEGKAKIFGTNKAFNGKEWATYFSELTPINKIMMRMHDVIGKRNPDNEQYLPLSLVSLLEFEIYPFNISVKIKKSTGLSYLGIFKEGDEITFDEINKYREKKVKYVYADSVEMEAKIEILEKMFKDKSQNNKEKSVEESFDDSLDYSMQLLDESGIELKENYKLVTKQAFGNMDGIISNSGDKGKLENLLGNADTFYFKHITMTSLVGCYILDEMHLSDRNLKQRLCTAANFHNIFLGEEEELKVDLGEQLGRFDEERIKNLREHALMATNLLKDIPEMDGEILKMIKEHHGASNGIGFTGKINSFSKMSLIFQVASQFAQLFIVDYEKSGSAQPDMAKICDNILGRFEPSDKNIIKCLRAAVVRTVE
jgi:hypothetical protein